MQVLRDYMDILLAQRAQFIRSFYAGNANAQENTARLLACARQLMNKKDSFFACTDIHQAFTVLQQKTDITASYYLLMLQLYARTHQNTGEVAQCLYHTENEKLKHSAPLFALLTQIQDTAEPATHNELLLVNQLLGYFYRQEHNRIAEVTTKQSNSVSPLIRLYLTVLANNATLTDALLDDFINCHYLQSELFELYIVRLDEASLMQVINRLSADKQHTALLINLMGLSGYSKFIPFLARFLQDRTHALAAHHALRLLLGEQLDIMIPNAIQFNSDEAQRIEDLTYYGAKILHHWDTDFIAGLGSQILSGERITEATLDKLLQSGSQAHRRVASIHKTRFAHKNAVLPYYACPELVL